MLAPKQPAPGDRNYTLTLLAIGVLVLLAVGRFFNLSADFPTGLTSYGATYTDEGWWSRNAVALIREGNWFIDDGYNTILNLPTVPLLQTLWFKAFGVSQVAARALTATCSVIVSALVYVIARRELKPGLAWIAPFIVLSSYPVFAFSRIALLEMPMMVLILLSLWLVTSPALRKREALSAQAVQAKEGLGSQLLSEGMLIASAVLAVLAILAKTTALFVPPMLLALIVLQPGSPRKKVHQGTVWLLSFLAVYGLYHAFSTYQGATESYSYFSQYNVTAKLHDSLVSVIKGPLRVLKYCAEVFPMLFSALVISIVTLAPHKRYRSSTLFQIVVLWSVLFLGGLSTSNYAAPRYLIVLIVPIALVIPLALGHFIQRRQRTLLEKINAKANLKKAAFFVLVPLSVLLSLWRISGYLLTPNYSFVSMAHQVEHAVEAAPDHSPVLMGHFADSLALVTDIKAINDEMGYQPLSYRIEKFNPGYYICVGEMKAPIAETLETYYAVTLLKTFDVYQNYDYGEPVFFYQLTPKQPIPVGALTSYEKPSP